MLPQHWGRANNLHSVRRLRKRGNPSLNSHPLRTRCARKSLAARFYESKQAAEDVTRAGSWHAQQEQAGQPLATLCIVMEDVDTQTSTRDRYFVLRLLRVDGLPCRHGMGAFSGFVASLCCRSPGTSADVAALGRVLRASLASLGDVANGMASFANAGAFAFCVRQRWPALCVGNSQLGRRLSPCAHAVKFYHAETGLLVYRCWRGISSSALAGLLLVNTLQNEGPVNFHLIRVCGTRNAMHVMLLSLHSCNEDGC